LKYLVTGAAGFIGHHFIKYLLEKDNDVVGIDNFLEEKLKKIKQTRISSIDSNNLTILNLDLSKKDLSEKLSNYEFDCVVHLAARAGIRSSFDDPLSYIVNNTISHQNILDLCRIRNLPLFFASSSSVYGDHQDASSVETNITDKPSSIYGITKKTNEMISKVYSEKYKMKIHGFRFFTVYGILGRPDMAYWIFTDKIVNDLPIRVFGDPDLLIRDFTHVNDIVEGLFCAINHNKSDKLFQVYNLGRGEPEKLSNLIECIADRVGKVPKIKIDSNFYGDVRRTSACIMNASSDFGYNPKINLREGIYEFCDWFKNFNK
tara:strand:+ start:416 stop:1369 length:954 start_codon:yes stop_codon:yes gene_type:complete